MATDHGSATHNLVLFEDALVPELGPLVETRPIFELVLGALTLRERIERVAGRAANGAWVRSPLSPLLAAVGLGDARSGEGRGEVLLVNGAWIADPATWKEIVALGEGQTLLSPAGRILAIRASSLEACRGEISSLPADPAGHGQGAGVASEAHLLRHSWELIGLQVETLRADLVQWAAGATGDARRIDPGDGRQIRGTDVFADEGAEIDAPVALDSRGGPIRIGRGACVAPFSVLVGPVFVGEGAIVLGGRIAQAYIGADARIRGEVESAVILAHTNKAHEGFVGHSYVGKWVNLGALTTTSDLKNNYGVVRIHEAGRLRETGLIKLGSLIADHAKTAIGTMLGTGTVIGTGSNVFGGGGVTPKWVPSFVWGTGPSAEAYDIERFCATAATVMSRRGETLSVEEQTILREAHKETRAERDAWLRERGGGA